MVNSPKRNDFTEIEIQFREGNLPKNKTYITKLEFLAHRSNATFYNPAPPMKSIQELHCLPSSLKWAMSNQHHYRQLIFTRNYSLCSMSTR